MGQSLAIPRVIPNDWKRLDLIVNKIKLHLGSDASPTWAGITLSNTGLHLLDTDASHDLIIAPGSDLTADRTLTLTTGDSDRTITLSGNPTLDDWFDQSVKVAASPEFAGLTLTVFTGVLSATAGVITGGAGHEELANLDFASAGHTGFQAQGDVLDDLNVTGVNTFTGDPVNDFLVGTAAGTLVWQYGATARTSMGLGTGDSPTFAGLTLTNAAVIGSNSVVFQPGTDSTTFFQVLDADGGIPILNVDTTNERVGIGTISPYSGLHYQGDIFYLTPAAGPESNDNITIKNYATGNGAPDVILRTADIAGAYGIGVGTLSLIGGSKTTHYGGIGHGGGKISLQGGQGRDAANDPSYYAPVLLQPTSGNVGIGTTTPNAPLEVKGAKPGVVGGHQSGQLQVTGTGGEFYCAVITGHNSFNTNTQLWYLGSTSSATHDEIAFINRQNAAMHFYTNNTSRMTIDATGNVTLAIIAAEGSDVDKFLVSSSGIIKYRTGVEVLSDIGGQASDAGLTSLAGLVYASDSFIKVTATDTYEIRTIVETKTDLSLNLVENTALSTWAGTANITTLGTIATVGNITIADGGTIGQAAGSLLTFDDTNNYLEITGCDVVIGDTIARTNFHVLTTNASAISWSTMIQNLYGASDMGGTGVGLKLKTYTDSQTQQHIDKWAGIAAESQSLPTYGKRVDMVFYTLADASVAAPTEKMRLTGLGTIKLLEAAAADADTAAYGQIWVKNTAPCTPWFTDDAGNDGQFMMMRSTSISSNSDAANVQGCNVLWVDTSGGNVVLGGLANGIDNQLLYVFKYGEANILTIEHQEGTGTQKFMMNGADLVYNGIGICLPFICKNGTWYIAAYPRSFQA